MRPQSECPIDMSGDSFLRAVARAGELLCRPARSSAEAQEVVSSLRTFAVNRILRLRNQEKGAGLTGGRQAGALARRIGFVVEKLVRCIEERSRVTAMHLAWVACKRKPDRWNSLESLLDVDKTDVCRNTALHFLCGDDELFWENGWGWEYAFRGILRLVQAGADPRKKNRMGQTPLDRLRRTLRRSPTRGAWSVTELMNLLRFARARAMSRERASTCKTQART